MLKNKKIEWLGLTVGTAVTLLIGLSVGAFFGALYVADMYVADMSLQIFLVGSIFIPFMIISVAIVLLYVILASSGIIK